jgi:hypothetical protein
MCADGGRGRWTEGPMGPQHRAAVTMSAAGTWRLGLRSRRISHVLRRTCAKPALLQQQLPLALCVCGSLLWFYVVCGWCNVVCCIWVQCCGGCMGWDGGIQGHGGVGWRHGAAAGARRLRLGLGLSLNYRLPPHPCHTRPAAAALAMHMLASHPPPSHPNSGRLLGCKLISHPAPRPALASIFRSHAN